jgi:hypothetical protein
MKTPDSLAYNALQMQSDGLSLVVDLLFSKPLCRSALHALNGDPRLEVVSESMHLALVLLYEQLIKKCIIIYCRFWSFCAF